MVKLDLDSPAIPEFTRYAALGAVSFILNLGLAAAFHEIFSLAEWLAVAVSLSIVFVTNFIAAKLVVFKSVGGWRKEAQKFAISSLLSRLFEYTIFLILFAVFSMNYLISVAISMIISFVLKFIVYKRYVFS